MRRIPRPQRSIDQITTSSHLLRHSSSPFACRSALNSPHLLRAVSATSSSSFSTSSSYGFLNAEKDPKKYKASIRKWQKRLTGDSEPIGAHVDPFDPTSPIRIRPEEQGDEVERLVEDKFQEAKVDDEDVSIESYVKQDSGDGLMWVGGKEWVKRMEDKQRLIQAGFSKERVRDMEKFVVSKAREANKMEVEKRRKKTMGLERLRWEFMQAFLPHYKGRWYDEAQIEAARKAIGVDEPIPLQVEATEAAEAEEGEILFDAAESAPEETTTTAASIPKAVVVSDKKPFDFMSNRPVPRAKPAQAASKPAADPFDAPPTLAAQAAETVVETVVATSPPKSTLTELEAKVEAARTVISAARQDVYTSSAERAADAIARLREEVLGKAVQQDDSNILFTLPEKKAHKWRHLPLDDNTKLKIYKELVSRTNLIIPDVSLHSSRTLGDLYTHLITASKPKPTKVYDQIKMESKLHPHKKMRGMEQLNTLPNVKLYKNKITEEERERSIGRWKVIEYALAERGLPVKKVKHGEKGWYMGRGEEGDVIVKKSHQL